MEIEKKYKERQYEVERSGECKQKSEIEEGGREREREEKRPLSGRETCLHKFSSVTPLSNVANVSVYRFLSVSVLPIPRHPPDRRGPHPPTYARASPDLVGPRQVVSVLITSG